MSWKDRRWDGGAMLLLTRFDCEQLDAFPALILQRGQGGEAAVAPLVVLDADEGLASSHRTIGVVAVVGARSTISRIRKATVVAHDVGRRIVAAFGTSSRCGGHGGGGKDG